MGLGLRYLRQIEGGTVDVTLAVILRICDACDVSPFIIMPPPKGAKEAYLESRNTQLALELHRPFPTRASRLTRRLLEKSYTPEEPQEYRVPPSWVDERRLAHPEPEYYLPNPIPPNADVPEMKKRVGRAIAHFRRFRQLTQAELAAKLSVKSVKYIQAVEGGKQNLRISSLTAFAHALDVKAYELWMDWAAD